ncbi:histone H1.0-like [Tubulanus polymorphus]|uniref:histone H1.0-like n=1 Tax=Tubulanus polymorphus TaxID=672921 RepID=UPI003DA3B358
MTDGGDATPTKSPKKAAKPKKATKPADHPKYGDMIRAAITSLKERSGSSRQAIIKYIKANYKVDDKCNTYVKLALKNGVVHGKFVQMKGVGASGSFKLPSDSKEDKPKKKVAKKPAAKKPAAKKAPKPKAKKPTKKVATKSPKKAKKPAAKKAASKSKKAAKKPAKAARKK